MRGLALVALALAGAVGLSGCVGGGGGLGGLLGIGDGYRETHRWLDEQAIVVAVTETNPYYEDLELRGEIHAELDPEATADEVEAFARDAAAFLAERDTYEVDLSAGRGGVDLAIRDVDDVAGRMTVWSSLEGERVAGARAVLVGAYHQRADAGPLVTTRVVSADSAAVLAELESRALPQTSLELQVFRDAAVLDEIVGAGSYYPSALVDLAVPTIAVLDGCDAAPGVRELALEVTAAGGGGGELYLCTQWTLQYAAEPIGALAIDLRSRLDAAGIDLPVSITARAPIPNAQTRDVVVSPGAADGLEILRHLDAPGALGELAGYTLDESRSLSVLSFRQPTGELADLVLASPGTAALTSVELRGERFAVAGSVGELGAITDGMTEVGRSDVISYADLTPEALTLFLVDDPAEADVRALARAVDASGLASSRTVTPDGDDEAVAWFDAELSTL